MLTYKTHVDKIHFEEWMKDTVKGQIKKIPFLRIAHENGDEICPYEHSHVVIDFGKGFQSTNVRIFDYNGIHPHFRLIAKAFQLEKAKNYISKEDPDCEDLKAEPNLAEAIWANTNLQDALKKARNASDVLGIKTLYECKPEEVYDFSLQSLRPFQELIWKIAYEKADGRHITWLSDEKGCSGKTAFIKHCISLDRDKFRFTTVLTPKDLATIIVGWIKDEGWKGDCIMVNLTRSKEDRDSNYDGLELLVDSLATSAKYKGQSFIWQPCHVIVMANFLPDVHKMSPDRWKLFEIDESFEATKISIQDAINWRENREKEHINHKI